MVMMHSHSMQDAVLAAALAGLHYMPLLCCPSPGHLSPTLNGTEAHCQR
jgi:hypothetical protein